MINTRRRAIRIGSSTGTFAITGTALNIGGGATHTITVAAHTVAANTVTSAAAADATAAGLTNTARQRLP